MTYKQNVKYRIVLCTLNSASGYSGGRYHNWMMAEALASRGHTVTVWTNNRPTFLNDFKDFPGHSSIKLHCSAEFRDQPDGNFDLVVLVPHYGIRVSDFYPKTMLLTLQNRAKLIFLNFETPNWFNSLSPEPRDTSLWRYWKEAGTCADLILSSSAEGNLFAKEFYTNTSGNTQFFYCYPSINSIVADRVKISKRKKQIICITRFVKGNKHKGGDELLKVLGPAISGYTVVVLIGVETIPAAVNDLLWKKAQRYGIKIKLLHGISDYQKFEEIKRSELMIFLSFFEGYGLPPIEAQYCQTPCIVYKLPVLREVSGDGLIYVPPGNHKVLQESIHKVLNGEFQFSKTLNDRISQAARFDVFAEKIDNLVGKVLKTTHSCNVGKRFLFNFIWNWTSQQNQDIQKLTKNLMTHENNLSFLNNDPFIKPIISLRFEVTKYVKRCLPSKIYNFIVKQYHKKNMD